MVKSIIDIDVNDAAFKNFQGLFDKYQKQLAKMPDAWKAAGTEADKIKAAFLTQSALLLAQNESMRKLGKEEKDHVDRAAAAAGYWRGIARSTQSTAAHIASATKELLKWGALTSVFSGLVGAGGLFGIDRLALASGAGRRQAQGFGTTTGNRQAFGINYGRLVDPDSFLSNVNEARTDASKRSALYAAGLSEGDIAGKDTASIATALIPRLKSLADQTPDALLAQRLQAGGLGNLIGLEDFQRLKNTSATELANIGAGYARDKSGLAIGDSTNKAWQDFTVQMNRAGQVIENSFIKGLVSLSEPMAKLSDTLSKGIEKWIGGLTPAIETFASYLGSDKFQNDVKSFADGIASLAAATVNALRFLGVIPKSTDATSAGPRLTNPVDAAKKWAETGRAAPMQEGESFLGHLYRESAIGKFGNNNPWNVRPKSGIGFVRYPDEASGVQGAAWQLRQDIAVHHQDTLRQVVYGNAEHGGWTSTDRDSYLKGVSGRTGIAPDAKLSTDNDMIAKLLSAMAVQEGSKKAYPAKVVIEILNNTGGNAVVSASQLPQ